MTRGGEPVWSAVVLFPGSTLHFPQCLFCEDCPLGAAVLAGLGLEPVDGVPVEGESDALDEAGAERDSWSVTWTTLVAQLPACSPMDRSGCSSSGWTTGVGPEIGGTPSSPVPVLSPAPGFFMSGWPRSFTPPRGEGPVPFVTPSLSPL